MCYHCDLRHASLFRGLTRATAYAELQAKAADRHYLDVDLHENTAYFRYRCPMLGYWEMVFPIFYQDKGCENGSDNIIGVLFVGQTLIDEPDEWEKVRSARQTFLEKDANRLFTKFCEHYNQNQQDYRDKISPATIQERIMKENEAVDPLLQHEFPMGEDRAADSIPPCNGIASMTVSRGDYEKLIVSACTVVKDIEKSLWDEMHEKRLKHFTDELAHLLAGWNKAKNDAQTIWRDFVSAVSKMSETYAFKNMYVFGDGKNASTTTDKKKRLLGEDGTAQAEEKPCFNFGEFANDYFKPFKVAVSLDDPILLDGIEGIADGGNLILLVCPNLAVAFEVESLEEGKNIYKILFSAIAKELIGMNARLELLTTSFLKEHHELTLRMYRHETAHIAERLSDRNSRYLGSEKDARKLTGGKLEDVYNDFKSSIDLVSNMALTIGIVLDRLSEDERVTSEEESISVFSDMFYKWEAMFSDKLQTRNLQIVVPPTHRLDPLRPDKMKINRNLFELLVFNLVDNAVKYAFRGTSIFIDCVKEGTGYVLSVVSLGPKIEEGDGPYGLYTRGKAEDHDSDPDPFSGRIVGGDGLGLFVVKRICEILHLTVGHHCPPAAPVADINVPLIKWYLELVPSHQQDTALVKRIQSYTHPYNRHPDYTNQWFCPKNEIQKSDLTVEYLQKRIKSSIYKTTFEVFIPLSIEE